MCVPHHQVFPPCVSGGGGCLRILPLLVVWAAGFEFPHSLKSDNTPVSHFVGCRLDSFRIRFLMILPSDLGRVSVARLARSSRTRAMRLATTSLGRSACLNSALDGNDLKGRARFFKGAVLKIFGRRESGLLASRNDLLSSLLAARPSCDVGALPPV